MYQGKQLKDGLIQWLNWLGYWQKLYKALSYNHYLLIVVAH